MSKKINIRIKTGPTVKQYGQFHLKDFEVYRNERKIPTNRYIVALDNEDGSYEELGTISGEKSTLSDLLDHLDNWQHARYNDIFVMKRVQEQAESEEAKARHQIGLDDWERQYLRVDRAIRELEPDYQPDESIYESHLEPPDENRGTCSLG